MSDENQPATSNVDYVTLILQTGSQYDVALKSAIGVWNARGGSATQSYDDFAKILGEQLQIHANVASDAAQRAASAGNSAQAAYWQNVAQTSERLANPLNSTQLSVLRKKMRKEKQRLQERK